MPERSGLIEIRALNIFGENTTSTYINVSGSFFFHFCFRFLFSCFWFFAVRFFYVLSLSLSLSLLPLYLFIYLYTYLYCYTSPLDHNHFYFDGGMVRVGSVADLLLHKRILSREVMLTGCGCVYRAWNHSLFSITHKSSLQPLFLQFQIFVSSSDGTELNSSRKPSHTLTY